MSRLRITRGFAVAISAAATVALLAGCTAGSDIGTGNPGAKAKPTASATPEAPKVTGDLEAQDIKVKDSLGEYTPVKLRDDSDALKIPETMVDFSGGNGGYSTPKAVEAAQWVARFAGSDVIDGVGLDTGETGWNEWKQNRADQFISTYAKDAVLGPITTGDNELKGKRSLVVLATPNDGKFPQMVRDGGPRVSSGTVKVTGVKSDVYQGSDSGIIVTGTTDVSYRVLSSKAKALMKTISPKNTDKIMEPYYPEMYSKKVATLELTDNWTYRVYMEAGEWKIYNYYTNWSADFKHDSKASEKPEQDGL